MNDLLQTAVAATVAASITSAIWFVKSQGDYLKNIVMTVDMKRERMVTDFPGQEERLVFEPSKLVMQHADGTPSRPAKIPKRFCRPAARDAVGRAARRLLSGRGAVDVPDDGVPLYI